jgi:phosphoserine phosphatase
VPTFTEISLFDLDKTLLKVNVSRAFGAYLYQHNELPFFSMLYALSAFTLHQAGFVSLQTLHQSIFQKLFLQRPKSHYVKLAQTFLDQSLDSLINPIVLKKLQEAQHANQFTAILSSSPDFLVQLIADRLQLDDWNATPYQTNPIGQFTHIGDILDGKRKTLYLNYLCDKFQISKEKITSYSDSHLDLPFLEASGIPIAVNPDKKLKAICQKRDWEII